MYAIFGEGSIALTSAASVVTGRHAKHAPGIIFLIAGARRISNFYNAVHGAHLTTPTGM
ncbi:MULTISPECIES: hypothetical protein [unclassified Caballeronia]|uniref:hypothetical protein n=1 Tax=unclassified Caballeronia TaxID=2646786 RepID=UPI00285AAC79|nr:MULTISPECIES: hypothetical protein [unclassified Caballeronia]MDR5738537.1 hypothetical protein [Caballeronia sp. LZ016]MDR5811611.1 hypothetical protein [Caballeronia sp. LZ019]